MTPEDDPSDAPAPSRLQPSDLTLPEETPPSSSRDGENEKDTKVNMSDTLKREEDEDKKAAEEQREFLQVHAVVHEEAVIDEENASEAADANAPPSSSSLSFVIPELRLDRSFSADGLSTPGTDEEYDEDDEDEEDEEEEDSDDNFLDRRDSGKRRSMVEATSCEKHAGGLSVQNSLRRRTHSEGSLLQDPRTTCFTSDNAINCMEASGTLLSPKTLKKELTKNGGSMHQLYMLFSGRKVRLSLSHCDTCRNDHFIKSAKHNISQYHYLTDLNTSN